MSPIAFRPNSVVGIEIFFVGGILNEEEKVQINVSELAKRCNEVITPFWNITWRTKLTERVEFDSVREDLTSRIIQSLLTGHAICVIAHSHGAVLVKESLKSLSCFYKKMALERIEAYTFGSVTGIPDGYARKVKNYRNATDYAHLLGRVFWDQQNESEPFSITTVSGRGEGHRFIVDYSDLAAEKIKKFKSQYVLSNECSASAPNALHDLALRIFTLPSNAYEPTDPIFPIRKYQKELDDFREFFQVKIEEINPETTRLTQVEIRERFLSFLNVLLDDAFSHLGPCPCNYDLRAYGSLARGEFGPYLDLKWMILVEKETEQNLSYFKNLAQILTLQIISIGKAASANVPVFSAIGINHPSEFHIDSRGNPALDSCLIGNPNTLANLQAFCPGPDGSEMPTDSIYSLRNTVSLRTTNTGLFEDYDNKMGVTLDDYNLKERRALDFLKFRLKNYKELFAADWRNRALLNIKKQFVELLYHPLSDLALYFGCKKTNTLEVIDELPCFTEESRSLLKKAVSFLYILRTSLHFHYDEKKEEVSLHSEEVEGFLRLEASDKFLLETTYYLILVPFYAYLENRFSEKNPTIDSISLLDFAFERACKNPNSLDAEATIFHLAKHLTREKNSDERYYRQLSERDLEHLRTIYLDVVKADHNSENIFRENLILALEKIPDSSGNRPVLKSKRTLFFQKLEGITSEDKKILENKPTVGICSPFFNKRYLDSEVVDAIFDETGRIKKQMQNTNSRVSFYEKGPIAFHFKEKPIDYKKESPFHPGREHAAAELMFRLFGRGTSISELFEFEVEVVGEKPKKYLVLISETVPGESPNLENPPKIDPIQLSELFLSLPLLLPGDMRPANLIATPGGELISIDSDFSWIKPYTKEGCNLYTILPFLYPEHILRPEAIQAFLALKPASILTGWLTEIIEYNKRVLSDFKTYEKVPEKATFFPSVYYTSTCCFERGTGAQLLLQFHQLQEFLRINQGRDIKGIEVLQTIIHMDQNSTVSVGTKIYEEYNNANERQNLKIADKVKVVTRKKVTTSANMSASSASFYQKIPQNKEELLNCAPEHALKEIKALSILKINEMDGLTLRTGEFSSLYLQSEDAFTKIDLATQRFLFKVLLLHVFEHLNLSYSSLDDSELKSLLEKTGKHLKVLDLRSCSNLTDKSIEAINQYCPLLEELYLSRCHQIKSFTIGLFGNSVVLENLKVLHLEDCPNLRSFKIDAPKLSTPKIYPGSNFPVSVNLADCLHIAGKNLNNLGRYHGALNCFHQALWMRQFLKDSYQAIANTWNNLGATWINLGDHAEALRCYRSALEAYSKWLGSKGSSIGTAVVLCNIGDCLNKIGKHDEALEYALQAFQMGQKLFQKPDLLMGFNLRCLRISLDAFERYNKALESNAQYQLEFTEEILENHLCHEEVWEAFEEALEMGKTLFGGKHFDIAEILGELGKTLGNLGRHEEALKYHKEALLVGKALSPGSAKRTRRNDLCVARSLRLVGAELNFLGRNEEALEYEQQALQKELDWDVRNPPDVLQEAVSTKDDSTSEDSGMKTESSSQGTSTENPPIPDTPELAFRSMQEADDFIDFQGFINEEPSNGEDFGESSFSSTEVPSAYSKEPDSDKGKEEESD